MLNLNYNINKALGGGGCIGLLKYNYSASISVIGGGGGGATDAGSQAGGGGGGGAAVSQSISILPNIVYQVRVGGGGAVGVDGQDSSFIGYDDIDNIPISFFAQGGKKGESLNGGNSGTGSIVRNGITTNYPGFTGGTGYSTTNAFGPQKGSGGGASNAANGGNASDGFGGNGANGITAGGGGGAFFVGPTGPYGDNGLAGTGNYGRGGDGYTNQQNGATNPKDATNGTAGTVIISYPGKPKAFVTNAVTTTVDNVTTHTFNSGSGTFLYQVPYPYEETISPYQVIVCPPTYREN